LELSTGEDHERSVLDAIAATLLERLDELTTRCVDRFQQDSDAYRRVPVEELREASSTGIRAGLASVTQLTGPGEEAATYAARIGEQRAQQGVPVEAVMQTFHAAAQVILSAWDQEAARLEVPIELVLRVHDLSWAWANFVMTQAARGHGRTGLELARRGAEQQAELVRDLLFGRLDPAGLEELCASTELQIAGQYMAFRASLDVVAEGSSQLQRALRSAAGVAHPLTAIIDGDLAGVLSAVPVLGPGHTLALGPAVELTQISQSFVIASETLDTVRAFGRQGVHTSEQLGVLPALLLADELGRRLDVRHFSGLDELGRFGDQLEETVRAYLASERNVGATAHRLAVHPNSVRHRLDRFQQATGLDLRETDSLVTAWWILKMREMLSASHRPISTDVTAEQSAHLGEVRQHAAAM